jgi:hypothetical protein
MDPAPAKPAAKSRKARAKKAATDETAGETAAAKPKKASGKKAPPKTPAAAKAAKLAPVTTEKDTLAVASPTAKSPKKALAAAPAVKAITSFFNQGASSNSNNLFKSSAVPKAAPKAPVAKASKPAKVAKPKSPAKAKASPKKDDAPAAAPAAEVKPWHLPPPPVAKETPMEVDKTAETTEASSASTTTSTEESSDATPMQVDEEDVVEKKAAAKSKSPAPKAAASAATTTTTTPKLPKPAPKKALKPPKPTIPLDDAKIAEFTAKRDAYVEALSAIPPPSDERAPADADAAPDAKLFEKDAATDRVANVEALAFIARHVEGKTSALPALAQSIENVLLDVAPDLTTDVISKTVALLASRKPLGVPAPKAAVATTDTDESHCWTWEVTTLDILPQAFVNKAIKPTRAARRKLSMRVKAAHRVIEVLTKTPGDADKIAAEEEKVAKFEREDEAERLKNELKEAENLKKFGEALVKREEKEKQMKEAELMKAEDAAQKAQLREEKKAAAKLKKEAEIVAKNALKTADELEKEAKEAALKEKRRAEKEAKEAALKKQSNMMKGFFTKKATTAPPKAAEIKVEAPVANSRVDAFWAAINANEPSECSTPKPGRKPFVPKGKWVKISVMATVFPAGAADDPFSIAGAPYSEPRTVTLYSRKKFLCFDEDVRPAYYGTWSKRSSAVTGRRPFGQEERFDYDYDSEAEWEEGDEGEGEDVDGDEEKDKEEEEDDVYNYDDGWMREDDDYGSDNEEGDGGALKAIRKEVGSKMEKFEEKVVVPCLHGGVPRPESKATNPVIMYCEISSVVLHLSAFPPRSSRPAKEKVVTLAREITDELMPEFVNFVTCSNIASKDKLVDEFCKRDFANDTAPSRAQTMKKLLEIAEKVKIVEGGGSAFVWRIKGTTPATGVVAAEEKKEAPKITGFLPNKGDSGSVSAFAGMSPKKESAAAATEGGTKETDSDRIKRLYGDMDLMALLKNKKAKLE